MPFLIQKYICAKNKSQNDKKADVKYVDAAVAYLFAVFTQDQTNEPNEERQCRQVARHAQVKRQSPKQSWPGTFYGPFPVQRCNKPATEKTEEHQPK
ncbi:MAG: hypothetical protein IT260_17990 [Saprospiraceae bacterium]|nr:hypothetical protein [Saprospiraceae bacterium]